MFLDTFTNSNTEKWEKLVTNHAPIESMNQLEQVLSFPNIFPDEDTKNMYLPILQSIQVKYQQKQDEQNIDPAPFIIGISGSVAVGKSTTARLLQKMLRTMYPLKNIELMTTDGFLYPNAILEGKGLMKRKGFPESYDMEQLLAFMLAIKSNEKIVEYPIYSHATYDTIRGEKKQLYKPDILIMEGVNVLQLPSTLEWDFRDFFDFSIYIDAHPDKIREWYLARYDTHLKRSQYDPTSYYYQVTQLPKAKVMEEAKKTWYSINYVNLQQHILPTRSRANLIIHKTDHHHIDAIYFRSQ